MAHQAHNIPWDLLTSNLEWKAPKPSDNFGTNLYPRMKSNQATDLSYFVEAFVKNLEEHAACERKKYQQHDDPPQPSDVILNEVTVRKISPSVRRWRKHWWSQRLCPSETCPLRGTDSEPCKCEPLPLKERQMSAFLRHFDHIEYCDYFGENNAVLFNLEVLKTLLLYGEMDALFRICAHPETHLTRTYDKGVCFDCGRHPYNDIGWHGIGRDMLWIYICLNVAYCFPELCDPKCGRTAEKDYRNTIFYQKTIDHCAKFPYGYYSTAGKFPHNQFFGLDPPHKVEKRIKTEENTEKRPPRWEKYATYREQEHPGPYGREPIHQYLSLSTSRYLSDGPSVSDTTRVRMTLCSKGLPVELALDIMEFANYEPVHRKLDPPHDPLHPSNREELGKYLKYCWQTMVRCFMLMKELGFDPVNGGREDPGMNWKSMIQDCIIELFGHEKDRGHDGDLEIWWTPDQRGDRIWYRNRRPDEEGYPGYVFVSRSDIKDALASASDD
ncbi:hypothetical protein N7481_005777 [Penicillium waksmanii]|uniref:uncharacterized protein n=1 Tax=Penicillium waksmanii TaxID=69791 RepID=UPI002549AA60|nr:uncharacterized protein N7481_005777 [Penicillium waksmanii]KAJ5983678.1 hypothetical protein N7481_005777 [Penicillium waksmanii]